MATGDSADIQSRIERLLPNGWWSTPAPIRDAVIGGIADTLAWGYSLLAWAKSQTRLATATGIFIDLYAYEFLGLTTRRRTGENDSSFRARVQKEILRERVTRLGMVAALTDLTGKAPIIIESRFGSDCGGWSSRTSGTLISCWGWSVGNAADQARAGITSPGGAEISQRTGYSTSWGARSLRGQVWMTVFRPGSGQGIANIGGWSNRSFSPNTTGGWSSRLASTFYGAIAWSARSQVTGAVTDQDIYDVINLTKPEGITVWVQLI